MMCGAWLGFKLIKRLTRLGLGTSLTSHTTSITRIPTPSMLNASRSLRGSYYHSTDLSRLFTLWLSQEPPLYVNLYTMSACNDDIACTKLTDWQYSPHYIYFFLNRGLNSDSQFASITYHWNSKLVIVEGRVEAKESKLGKVGIDKIEF